MMGMAGTVNATLITQQFNFTATRIGASAPTDPVIGSATLTYDPMEGDVIDQTTNITLNSLNISLAGTKIAFSFFADEDRLLIGWLRAGATGQQTRTNDYLDARVFSL